MKFEFCHKNLVEKSFRTDSIKTAYDIKGEKFEKHFSGEIPIENVDWKIGLIVGSSGSGKSSIANRCFEGQLTKLDWEKSDQGQPFIEDFDQSASMESIQQVLGSVGFSSPIDWLKPFHVLSNGEKMRAELARHILSKQSLIVYDEFTSVVDRQVASITSHAVQKAIRRHGKQFVAISCHRDIVDWLQPDWVYDTDEQRFFFTRKTNDQALKPGLSSATNRYGSVLLSITI